MHNEQERRKNHLNALSGFCENNNIKITEELGQGAFKYVFLAEEPGGRKIALKVASASTVRAAREIDSLQKLNHPNISKLYRHEEITHNNLRYVVTLEEYLSGGRLTDRLPLNEQDAFKLLSRMADVLMVLDREKLVHRDIKPDNIMYRDNDEPVLIDFGLVRVLQEESLTRTYALMGPGTPIFAPPEQLNNQKGQINWRADQFSLGITVLCAFFGNGFHPYAEFTGEELGLIIDRVRDMRIIPNSTLAKVSKEAKWFSILIKMIQPEIFRRYRKPEDLINSINLTKDIK